MSVRFNMASWQRKIEFTQIDRAVAAYAEDVRERRFPGAAETYFTKAAE